MDDMLTVALSWPFLLIGFVVFMIMAFFNGLGKWKGIGYYLWATGNKQIRHFLKFMEAVKVLFLPIIGFCLGFIPMIPRPAQLESSSQLSVALLYSVAGLCSMLIVKFLRKTAEARGIDVDLDLYPKEQKRKRLL